MKITINRNSQAVHSRNSPATISLPEHTRIFGKVLEIVTWRDVTSCHQYSKAPLLSGTTGHYRILPVTTGWYDLQESPESRAISSYV
eukprot:831116-Amorphochlora_amoeboformis.AAC.1